MILAPEMANWTEEDGMQSAGPHKPFNGEIAEYYRADLCANPALLAEAVEVLREAVAAWELHNKSGDMMQGHWAGDARAFIAKWENRHDR